MATPHRAWRWILIIAVLVALALPGACSTLRGGRVLLDALEPAASMAESVEKRDVLVPVPGRADLVMTIYEPVDDAPRGTLVLVHGATPRGRQDARLASLACGLTRSGLRVALPQLDALAAYTVDGGDIDRLVAATLFAAEQAADGSGAEQVALMGISIGGSYAVVAAGRSELDGRLTALCTFGAAADLGDAVIDWLAGGGHDPQLAIRGRRELLLANLPTLVASDDLDGVRRALADGPEGSSAARLVALAPSARQLLAMAWEPGLADAESVRAVFAPLLPALTAVSPRSAPLPGHAPAFLAHAVADPLVPHEQLSDLAELLDAAGASVTLQVTHIFDHVDALSEPSWLDALPLARFFGRFLDAAEG